VQDIAGWRQVVCGLCFKTRHKSSQVINILHLAVSCSLVMLVMIEAGGDEVFCRNSSAVSIELQ